MSKKRFLIAVPRLESHERPRKWDLVDLGFAVIDLDGFENGAEHHDIDRQNRLEQRKLEAARDSTAWHIWLALYLAQGRALFVR